MTATAFVDEVRRGRHRGLRFNLHPGQRRAWNSRKRIVGVIAGNQGGKTALGPPWLQREIQRRGPGDYLVVTPTYPLLALKALPEFRRLFETQLGLGEYVGSPTKKFSFSPAGAARLFGRPVAEPTTVYFGHASEPESLEASTVKGAWLDEAGQKKFKLASWEAIQRRIAIHQARVLITTTPYDLGWLKKKIYDPWKAGDPLIDVISFDSTENPAYPREEFERARRELPPWKFDLFYRARFTRPAGLIYDCFDDKLHVVPRFRIADGWRRYLGLDFGGLNTAGVFFAEEPSTKRLYAYREYKPNERRTAKGHRDALLAGEPGLPICVGGAKSEGQWRDEFAAAGLPVQEPEITEVEVGIDRVYAAIQRGEFYVFSDLTGLLAELGSYSRVLNEMGEPTEAIEDKEDFHELDAVRYIVGWVKGGGVTGPMGLPRGKSRGPMAQIPKNW